MFGVDCVVVGAGVVGLSTARALAAAGREVLIVEASPRIGTGVSSRSSEVIHAGLYYPRDSLKAKLCVAGNRMLYEYCETRGIPHRRVGKLVVATDVAQCDALDEIEATAVAAGVDDLQRLDFHEVLALEPELRGFSALLSPSTGIVDSQALMLALLGDAEAHGATLACGSRVSRIERESGEWKLHCDSGSGLGVIVTARCVVNAAGLGAHCLARATAALSPSFVPRRYLAKGNYFAYLGRVPFHHLVYPVPEPGGLGTHLTLDLAGRARFGPDVEWIEREDYAVDGTRHPRFAAAAQRFWPKLDQTRLVPAFAGIRPKIVGPGEAAADFQISGPSDHGLEGLVNLFGIESPGITASLALAQEVVGRLDAR